MDFFYARALLRTNRSSLFVPSLKKSEKAPLGFFILSLQPLEKPSGAFPIFSRESHNERGTISPERGSSVGKNHLRLSAVICGLDSSELPLRLNHLKFSRGVT